MFYLADLWVIRSSEIGQHEDYIHCRSHLGKHLEVGDECLGYDLKTSNINSDNLDNLGPIPPLNESLWAYSLWLIAMTKYREELLLLILKC